MMAMTMTGEVQLLASREVVWAKLNDASETCIPGQRSSTKLPIFKSGSRDDKIGPVGL
jgi:hypothetical protein